MARISTESWIAAERLADEIREAIKVQGDVNAIVRRCHLPAFVQSRHGVIVFSNRLYDALFADGAPVAGRTAESLFDEVAKRIARKTDHLIELGCTAVCVKNFATNIGGGGAELQTAKVSLLGLHHPSIAIVGICEIIRRVSRHSLVALPTLEQRWRCYEELSEFDRTLLTDLGLGVPVKEIAKKIW